MFGLRVTKEKTIQQFFNLSLPCNFDGCGELKKQFEKDLKNKKISVCKDCRRLIVIEKYKKILDKLIT